MDFQQIKIYLQRSRIYIKLYWIRIIVITVLIILGLSLIFLLWISIRTWNQADSYLREAQLALIPLQLYLQIVMALIFGVTYTFMWYWLFMKRGAQAFTQNTKKAIRGEEINIKWSDVIGMEEAKQEAMEVVNLIKDRAAVQKIGGKILRGLLMIGPPGCGKTYLAKAIATESGVPFISMSGSEFVEMFVGVGASRVRSLFNRARLLAQLHGGCIIFIDEIDAVGAQRALDTGFGGQREANTTVNQLLVEMDGLKEKDLNVVVIGATNAPESFLDPALLRPGRFDRKIVVDMPNLEDREKLFAYYLNKVKYDKESIRIEHLARLTVGNSPADIANLVHEAALLAVRHKKPLITMKEIDEARERIVLGIKRRVRLREEEKWQLAYHEAGHAIVTYLLVPSQDVFKISIMPRGHTGGATWTPEREEIFIHDQRHYLGQIKASLGAYVAERLVFGYTTGGVNHDFTVALWYAHHMAWSWGMGPSGIVGNYSELKAIKQESVSEEMTRRLDQDAQQILQSCLKEVEELLRKERPILDRLAKELVAKQELNYDEIEAIFKEFGKTRPANF
ncbi:MAG: AAA family ATPase [Candidatus Omnitrophica bacterium]|nr:AAA family ATPase [Candidatus Omnitrophota bacterium]